MSGNGAMLILWKNRPPSGDRTETLRREVGWSLGLSLDVAMTSSTPTALLDGGAQPSVQELEELAKKNSIRYRPGVDSLRYVPVVHEGDGEAYGVVIVEFGQESAPVLGETRNGEAGGLSFKVFDGFSNGCLFSPDGTRVLAQDGHSEALLVIDAHDGQVLSSVPHGQFKTGGLGLCDMCWSPDGSRIATAGSNGLRVIDLTPGAEAVTLSDALALGCTWSLDGARIAVLDGDTAAVLDVADGTRTQLHSAPRARLQRGAFLPGERLVVSGEFVVVILSLTGGAPTPLETKRQANGLGCSVSADGARLAYKTNGGDDIELWELEPDPNLTRVIKPGGVRGYTLSPDGSTIAAAKWGGGVNLLNWNDDSVHEVLQTEGEDVLSVSWSPDGTRLAAVGTSRLLRVFSLR